MRIGILLIFGKHLHGRIISLRGVARAHVTCLTPELSIEVSVPRQECEQSCICVRVVSILPLNPILLFDLGIFPKAWNFIFRFYTTF